MAITTEEQKENPEKTEQSSAATNATPEGQAPSQPRNGETEKPEKKPWILIVAAVLLLCAGVFGFRYWSWSQVHVSTDDAEIASDLVQIAPQVNGTVTQVLVADNAMVKAGQLLVQLDPATYQVAVDQAKA